MKHLGTAKVFTINASDLARCPDKNMSAEHWRSDGTCLHEEQTENNKVLYLLAFVIEVHNRHYSEEAVRAFAQAVDMDAPGLHVVAEPMVQEITIPRES